MVAQARGDLEKAEAWYQRSLTILEELGDRARTAASYAALGRLAHKRGDLPAALERAVRCVSLFEQFPHPTTQLGLSDLRHLAAQLGIHALEHAWQTATGTTLPPAVRAYATAPDNATGPGDSDA